MIPKQINYIWLGGAAKSNLTNICITTWYKHLHDYKIVEWNESNLNVDELCRNNRFLMECRKRKLWAFMADYLRLYVLYEFGGIYLDTDVQVLKSFDDLLDNKVFIGYEYFTETKENCVTHGTGVIGAEPKNPIIKKCLDFYDNQIWNCDVYYIPTIFTIIFDSATQADYKIYPVDYFAPYDYRKIYTPACITENTHAIHWFSASWHENKNIGLFLQTKHIKNPLKKKWVQTKKLLGYYKRKYQHILREIIK